MRAIRKIAFCLALLIAGLGPALAQSSYPEKFVRIVVGFGPGSAADLSARMVAQGLTKKFGQQFIVENRPGGGSTIAAEQTTRAPKDGYTLFIGSVANVINGILQPNLAFDFAKDFSAVSFLSSSPNILVVHPSTNVKDVAGLIALAKSKPGEVMFGSSGVGTSPHLSGELFNIMAGVKMVHVPYQGSAQAVTDLLAGRTQVMFAPASTVLPHIEAGKLVGLASSELKRASAAPNFPTISESGLPGFDTSVWIGLMAPAGTPADVVQSLSNAINEVLKSEEVAKGLRGAGLEIKGGSPADFQAYIKSETEKWRRVVEAAGQKK